MNDWEPKQKQYPHFDAPLRKREMRRLVSDPKLVAHHEFLPFLKFSDEWQPFRRKAGSTRPRPSRKVRVIRYASRRDTAVFSYYRWLLAQLYEAGLVDAGLSPSVLAYRRITTNGGTGKNNINFARDAFEAILRHDKCVVVALDISQFFESLDHARLERVWAELLGVADLPPDHKHVFANITRYADVSRDEAYVRYGHASWISVGGGKKLRITSRPLPLQLGSMREFREKIAGKGGGYPKLIEVHTAHCGVPQGAPLSDLLANMYLFEFDQDMQKFVGERSGTYFRYSDDILIILPSSDPTDADKAEAFAEAQIRSYGPALQIKPSKTSAYFYWQEGTTHRFRHLRGKAPHGLEYLGFRFDGRNAHIRASTLSGLHRNIVFASRAAADAHVARYPGKSLITLQQSFNIGAFMQKFGRVKDFHRDSDPSDWTFWTYAVRARRLFGEMGKPIERQLGRYRDFVRRQVAREVARAYRDRR